nr:hypothetical protein GCM10020093_036690 [Planobispora longispora]
MLSRTRVTVVCAGVKSILDVPATLQRLETRGVTVVGFRTDEFPGFYLHSSGERLDWRIETPGEAAEVMRAQDALGGPETALIVANPVPLAEQLDPALHDRVLSEALAAAERRKVTGQAITPFLLDYLVRGTGGASSRRIWLPSVEIPTLRDRSRHHGARKAEAPVTEMGLLVIGDVVTDVVALHGGPGLAGLEIGTDTAADIALRPGGSGANTASWAARLGADARILTRVGSDTSEWHGAELRRSGVRPHLRVDPERPTAVVIAMVDVTGERSMLTNRGAGGHIGIDDWDEDLLDGVAHLHLSGYTLFAEPGLRLSRLALAEAARRGVTTSVDPASTGFLRAFGPERFVLETRAARILIPNRDEALFLTGETSVERAAELLSLAYGAAAVKLGPGAR